MSDKPSIEVVVTRRIIGNPNRYVVLVDGKYWHCNEWEFSLIQQGAHPEDLGMYPWDIDEDD